MIKINENQELVSDFWKLKPFKKVKIKNEQAHIRADWIDKCAKLVKRPYPQMASLFYGFPLEWIKELYETATSFKANSPALFWQKLKEYRK